MSLTANLKYFDTYAYVKKSKELGASEQLAEYQVSEMEKAIEIAVSSVIDDVKAKDLATKGDVRESELRLQKEIEVIRKEIEIVRKEIAQAKNQTLIWTFGMLTGFSTFMFGAMAKGFHWW